MTFIVVLFVNANNMENECSRKTKPRYFVCIIGRASVN
jgi:hypothetical protein